MQQAAFAQERGDIAPGFAGQGIGMIQELHPAAPVLEDLVRGAEKSLGQAADHLAKSRRVPTSSKDPSGLTLVAAFVP